MPSQKKRMKKALLIRTSSWEEILGSYDVLKAIEDKFDVDDVELLAAEDASSLTFQNCDRRFADVIAFPTENRKALFLKFPHSIRKKKYRVCVLAFLNARPQFNLKYILCLLLCRGKKYLYLRRQGFVPLQSKQGMT